jgi:hypothetical protein
LGEAIFWPASTYPTDLFFTISEIIGYIQRPLRDKIPVDLMKGKILPIL